MPPSGSSNSMNSLVVEGVYLSKVTSNQSSSTPGLPRCVFGAGSNADTNEPPLLPTTAAAMITVHPSDASSQLHVSRTCDNAQLSRPFYHSSSASYRTPPNHCGSAEHEQHLLSRCTHILCSRQCHNLLCRRIHLQQIATKTNPTARR